MKDDQILSLCKVSDVYNGCGNLVVCTNKDYRRQGLGQLVVKSATDWCFKNDILPIYFTNQDNHISISFIKKAGFKKMQKEFSICTFNS